VTHTTFQELLLTPNNVHEILGFEILSSEKHCCHWEISEILLRVRGLDPCKNGVIALWPNMRVVKCQYYVSQKQNGFNNKIHWYSILLTFISDSRTGFNGLKYMYSVISVIVDSLPGNNKNRESTRSWTARVRLVHPWAAWSFGTEGRLSSIHNENMVD